MVVDPLSDLLKSVRLTGAVFFEIAARGAWAVGSPAPELILPRVLPGADHLIAFHVVTEGRCCATIDGGEPVFLETGEVVIFVNADRHVMSSEPGVRAQPFTADALEVFDASEKPFCINFDSDEPAAVRVVCGYLACDHGPFNPLLDNLPPVIKAGEAGNSREGWLGQFIRLALVEAADKRAGGESVLTKLSELMFIDVLRHYIAAISPGKTGWLVGLRDPFTAKVLTLLHTKPSRDWTIEDLAKETGQSRSVLAERFSEVVGIPPMHYLAKWRMQLASEMLAGGSATMAEIAADVGYASEAAFSRAFKKVVGMPPSEWRRSAKPRLSGTK